MCYKLKPTIYGWSQLIRYDANKQPASQLSLSGIKPTSIHFVELH